MESIDNVEHSLHLPGFSATVPLYDTSFPILVERCTRTTLFDILPSLLEFLVTVIGSGSTQRRFFSDRHFFSFRLANFSGTAKFVASRGPTVLLAYRRSIHSVSTLATCHIDIVQMWRYSLHTSTLR